MIEDMTLLSVTLFVAWLVLAAWLTLSRSKMKAEQAHLLAKTELLKAKLKHQKLETEHLQIHLEQVRIHNAMVEKKMSEQPHN